MDVQKYLAEKSAATSSSPPMDVQKYLQQKAGGSQDDRSAMQVWNDATDIRNMPANMAAGLKKIDDYTGAPIRKFVTETVTGSKMDHAPTGAEQAKMMGATDKTYGEVYGVPAALGGNISPADIYGVGLDMVQDPLLLAGKVVKGAKGLVNIGETAAESFGARQATKLAQGQAATATAESGAGARAVISGGGVDVEQGGKLFSVQAPKSLEELRNWKPESGAGELPGKARLQQIEQTVPDLQTKPLKYHYDMMENPKAMKDLKLQFENLPSDDAKRIAAYNQQMVDESGRKVAETVKGISPTETKTLSEAGDDLISTVKDKYNAEKEALGPVFQDLQKSPPLSKSETMDLAQAIGANTKLGKIMSVGEDGKLFLEKNAPRTGISDAEHSVLSRVISDMNEGMTFKEMQDTRDFLRKSMDTANPAATAEIGKVRSIMLGQMEDMAAKRGANVGETFKSYATNERARENVEKVIGGKIESLDSMYAANPDRVVQKIFANPNYAKVVGEYVGPEKMQEMVASYIQNGVKGSYDSAKGFDPAKLRGWLKTNSQFLDRYAGSEVTQRLNALADYGYYGKRFLDEVNPSGTAASLLAAIKPEGFLQKISTKGILGAVESETFGRVNTSLKQKQATETLNEALGTKKPSTSISLKNRINISPDDFDKAKEVSYGSASLRGVSQGPKQLPSSADKNDSPKKGPDKWADDGLKKLLEHDKDGALKDTALEQLKKTKAGRDLLIRASDLSPGSKAMDKVMSQIKSASKGEE